MNAPLPLRLAVSPSPNRPTLRTQLRALVAPHVRDDEPWTATAIRLVEDRETARVQLALAWTEAERLRGLLDRERQTTARLTAETAEMPLLRRRLRRATDPLGVWVSIGFAMVLGAIIGAGFVVAVM